MDKVPQSYVVDKRLFEMLFDDYSPYILELLNNKNTNPILLSEVKIFEYDEIKKAYAGCDLKYMWGAKDQLFVKFYFEISRSQINLICNFSGLFSVLVEKCNKNLYKRKAFHLQKKMATLFLVAALGEKIESEPFIIGNSRKELLHEYFFSTSLTFLFCHEIGHAILCCEDRSELDEAIEYIKSNNYLEDDETINDWAKELASDYIALKLFSMRIKPLSENLSEDISLWSSLLCLIHLYPCSVGTKTKEHPPQNIRINFLFQYARHLNFNMIGKSTITNFQLMENIAHLMNLGMENWLKNVRCR